MPLPGRIAGRSSIAGSGLGLSQPWQQLMAARDHTCYSLAHYSMCCMMLSMARDDAGGPNSDFPPQEWVPPASLPVKVLQVKAETLHPPAVP